MKEKTLVILAAGQGSRYGGMKQVEEVGPNGEFIMDYSIYSAKKYGFNKVVLIIREEYLDLFKNSIGKRLENQIKVEYAFQKIDDIPEGFSVPEGRVKPWGTAHAIYSAREYLNGPFGVITADDFYGDDAFKVLSKCLDYEDEYSIVGYPIISTLSENGAVKRGVIVKDNDIVKEVIESSCIKVDDHIECTPLDTNKTKFDVNFDNPVSMLMNGFTPKILKVIGDNMYNEFKNNQDKLLDYEMLLPDIMDEEIQNGQVIRVINTNAKWVGITYKEDLDNLKNHILSEINDGVYPYNLWN